jgi:hypothetical protein
VVPIVNVDVGFDASWGILLSIDGDEQWCDNLRPQHVRYVFLPQYKAERVGLDRRRRMRREEENFDLSIGLR